MTVVTLVGHGIWVLLAAIVRAIGGSQPAPRKQYRGADEYHPIEAQEALRSVRAQLERFARDGVIDAPTAKRLMGTVEREAQALRMAEDARPAIAAAGGALEH